MQRKYLINFPKIRGWGCKEMKESKEENVTKKSEWVSMLRTGNAWGKDMK